MDRNIKKYYKKIESEFNNLDDLIFEVKPYIKKFKETPPISFEDNCVITKTLQNFYDGIESIFKLYLDAIGEKIPSSESSHKITIEKIIPKLKLSGEVVHLLDAYRAMRNVAVHIYAFDLEWDKCNDGFLPLEKNWDIIKDEIEYKIKNNLENFKSPKELE